MPSLRIIITAACLSPPWVLASILVLWSLSYLLVGFCVVFSLLSFSLLHSKNIFLKGRFGSAIPSDDFPVRHYMGTGRQSRTPYLWCWGIQPWTQRADVHQQAARVTAGWWARSGNQDRREQVWSLMPRVHKSLTSLVCVNWLRSELESFSNKLWKNIVIGTNPSSPPPCSVPRPQNLCSDHSIFPMLSSQRHYKHSNQVNFSCLLRASAICGCHTDQGSISGTQQFPLCHFSGDTRQSWQRKPNSSPSQPKVSWELLQTQMGPAKDGLPALSPHLGLAKGRCSII